MKVYEGRHCYPFDSTEELKARILEVWNECATDVKEIRQAMKQFLPRLQAVESIEGTSIKTIFGCKQSTHAQMSHRFANIGSVAATTCKFVNDFCT